MLDDHDITESLNHNDDINYNDNGLFKDSILTEIENGYIGMVVNAHIRSNILKNDVDTVQSWEAITIKVTKKTGHSWEKCSSSTNMALQNATKITYEK